MELAPERDMGGDSGASGWWRLRWWAHLVILGSYPLVLAGMAASQRHEGNEALLPRDSSALVAFTGETLLHFAIFFVVAWLCSRATAGQLLLPWRDGLGPIWRGFVYSIALRLLVMVIGLFVVLVLVIIRGSSILQTIRPPAESVIDPQALAADPLYLVLIVTLVSFVMAGFREELWRAGVFAALWALFPKLKHSLGGQIGTVLITAILFGLGHWSQGWFGVALTTTLGLALGAIMVFHRSLWDAVLAHGFFDATTFMILYVIVKIGWDFGR